jgi:hypothetical protein
MFSVLETIMAFCCREFWNKVLYGGFDRRNASGHRFRHGVFDLGQCLFDEIEVGAVGGEEDQQCFCFGNGFATSFGRVAAKIVHDDDVTRAQARHKNLRDIIDAQAESYQTAGLQAVAFDTQNDIQHENQRFARESDFNITL